MPTVYEPARRPARCSWSTPPATRSFQRPCTEKLAAALGIANRVRWLDGLGHYTAMAALPETLQAMTDFFAQDLPPGVTPPSAAAGIRSPQRTLAELIRQLADLLTAEPKEGCCHLADLEVAAVGKDGKKSRAESAWSAVRSRSSLSTAACPASARPRWVAAPVPG